jgi:hypothetical protein
MRTEVVYRLAGIIEPTREYGDAKPRLFPYSGIDFPYADYAPGMYSKERGTIYVCPTCVQARNIWQKKHP